MLRVLAVAVVLALPAPALAEQVPGDCAPMVKAIGAPEVNGHVDHTLLCRAGYVLSHDNERKTPNWVVEKLTPDRLVGPGDRKGTPFAPDAELEKGKRAELADYRSTSAAGRRFDRGHMAEAAAMKFSEQAMAESFLLSNMAPQQGIGLNRAIWSDLEAMVRDWTCDRGELHVITGPIYDDDGADTLGDDKVAVPTAFFKIAVDARNRRAIAFILPNVKIDRQGKPAREALKPYITTIREVEERAGLRLLTALDQRERRRISTLRSVMWPVRDGCPN